MSRQIVRIKSTGELGIVEGEYTIQSSQQGRQELLNINIIDPDRDYMTTDDIRHIDPSDLEVVDRSSL